MPDQISHQPPHSGMFRVDNLKTASTKQMPKITYLANSLGFGGAAKRIVCLALDMKKKGWQVEIVVLCAESPRLVDKKKKNLLRDQGIPLVFAGVENSVGGLIRSARTIFSIARLSPDILHTNMFQANILGRIAKLLAPNTKIISTVVNERESSAALSLLYLITALLADYTVHVTKASTKKILLFPTEQQRRVIPNGVETNRIHASTKRHETKSKGFTWTCVASFFPKKDHATLLSAFHSLQQKHSQNRRLLLLGDGPLRPELEKQDRALNYSNSSVYFLGNKDKVHEYLRNSDAFVLASRHEGHSNALLEAATCGLPIVATDVGGNKEIVENGRNGFLAAPGEPFDLAKKMRSIETLHPDDKVSFSEHSKNIARAHFSKESMLQKWASLYNEALSN